MKPFLPMRCGPQRCPDCDESIAADHINIKEGMALCPQCGRLSRLSELHHSVRSVAEILARPPAGCALTCDGQRMTASVSLRSFLGFVVAMGMALFWNGIISIFVLIAIAGLYANLIGPLPSWFPAPGIKDGKPEMNDGPMELGMTLFLCVFLLPFVAAGVGMLGAAIMNLIGKVEVVIDEFDSYVATRLGLLRWKQQFDAREVQAVQFGTTSWQSNGENQRTIEIVANRIVKFGGLMPADRMNWLRAVLQQTLVTRNMAYRVPSVPRLSWLSRESL